MSTTVGKKGRLGDSKMPAKASPGVKTRFKAGSLTATKTVKKAGAKSPASYILSAPKGVRTLSHRTIKQAVERAFLKRYGANG